MNGRRYGSLEDLAFGLLRPGVDSLVDGIHERVLILLALREATQFGGRLGDGGSFDVELVSEGVDRSLHVRLVHVFDRGGICHQPFTPIRETWKKTLAAGGSLGVASK
ncbi:hypothetical protein PENTCL1PPCAC_29313, partial [Pristionchus entomophagus]